MDTDLKSSFLPDKVLTSLHLLFQRFCYPFLSTLICGLLAHGFTLTNKLVGNDELHHLFLKGTTVTSGRWGLELTPLIFPNFSMPWIYGLISILLVALTVCLMVDLFDIRSKALQLLLGGLVATFPTLTATLIYMFTSSSYALSFLLSTLSVWLLCRKRRHNIVLAGICLVLSLSIYQAYLSVATSLLVLVLIQRVLLQQEQPGRILRSGVCFALFLLLSTVAYYGILTLILMASGQALGGYASGALNQEFSILQQVLWCYKGFFSSIITGRNGLVLTTFAHVLHILALLAVLIGIILWMLSPRKKGSRLLLVLLGCMLPIATNLMYLISTANAVHTLMLYSMVSIYLLAVIVLQLPAAEVNKASRLRTFAVNLVPVCMALIIAINTYVANEVSLKLYLMYENSYTTCSSLSTQFRQTPGYTEQTPVAIIGSQKSAPIQGQFDHLEHLVGHFSTFLVPVNYQNMFRYYLGAELNLVEDPEQIKAITATAAVTQMPCWPDYGSVQLVDGTLVVKFS